MGELAKRIISEAILDIVRTDIIAATGSLLVCAGVDGGCEAAVYVIRDFLDDFEAQNLMESRTQHMSIMKSSLVIHTVKGIYCINQPQLNT